MKPVSGNEKILYQSDVAPKNADHMSDELMVTNRRLYVVDRTLNNGTNLVMDVEEVKKVSYTVALSNNAYLSLLVAGGSLFGIGILLSMFYTGAGIALMILGAITVLIGIFMRKTKGVLVIHHTGGEIKVNLTNPNMMQIRDAIFLAKDEVLKK